MKEKKITPRKASVESKLFFNHNSGFIVRLGGGTRGLYDCAARILFRPPIIVTAPAPSETGRGWQLAPGQFRYWNAKKIVASQANKINDSIASSQDSLVGIFKKNPTATTSIAGAAFDISDYYKLSDAISEGLVVDERWLGAYLWFHQRIRAPTASLKNFVAITKNKDVYNLDQLSQSGIGSYVFVHLAKGEKICR